LNSAQEQRRLKSENAYLRSQLEERYKLDGLVGRSPVMRDLFHLLEVVASTSSTVLITGETGTGKELAARAIHHNSPRRANRFVAINCSAIPETLLEAELFGHTRGAFTSAHQEREGLFVAARGGTLYLDEISELPLSLEVKLLRALEESAIRPVGADREVAVDARIVASTQHDLAQLVAERRFREDLYFRLNVVHIVLPPLRDRPEDVAALAAHFMQSLSAELGMQPMPLEESTLRRLQEHHWPGNVRELKNVIERTLMLGQLPEESLNGRPHAPQAIAEYPLDWSLDEVKDHHMTRVLEAAGGNKSAAARRLGVSRKTLERRLQVAAVRAARRQ
jgi:transcriptional regulator with PAS, ATPase and Fis domain